MALALSDVSDVEVIILKDNKKTVLGYCSSFKHPTAYMRNVVVRCKAPLTSDTDARRGVCKDCWRRIERYATRDTDEARVLTKRVNGALRQVDRGLAKKSKVTNVKLELASKIDKKRKVYSALERVGRVAQDKFVSASKVIEDLGKDAVMRPHTADEERRMVEQFNAKFKPEEEPQEEQEENGDAGEEDDIEQLEQQMARAKATEKMQA